MNNFDVGIIGAGVAGSFAALKMAKDHKNVKTILFDLGRPPMKRRRQLEGWLGCLPNSDGKLYTNDVSNVSDLTGMRKAKAAHNYFDRVLSNVNDFKVVKDRSPSVSMEKKLRKHGYQLTLNDYVQIYPKDIHALSKYMAEVIEHQKNVTFSFDNEVKEIFKYKGGFTIKTEMNTYNCKKLIVAVGRSGWRWASELYAKFGIVDNNDFAQFGIRIEMNSSTMKDFNKSNCSFSKDNIEAGPLSWFGTVIPEDHLDLAISAFRSNENRWKSDKVSFNLIGKIPSIQLGDKIPNRGFEETDRVGKLTFVLANDRIIRERVAHILTGKSKISIIPEYHWLGHAIKQLAEVLPEVATKAYYHVPTILPFAPRINIGANLETEIEGMFVAGESAGVHGILAAGVMGAIAADAACK
jgi:uncharacterized FAD-dependent dehydrogenase